MNYPTILYTSLAISFPGMTCRMLSRFASLHPVADGKVHLGERHRKSELPNSRVRFRESNNRALLLRQNRKVVRETN